MSSVIVLDSSDEEETPAKKPYLSRSIPATITPIPVAISTASSNNITPKSNSKPKKSTQQPSAPRSLPSGITITRRSPITINPNSNSCAIKQATVTPNSPAMQTHLTNAQLIAAAVNSSISSNNNNNTHNNNVILTELLTNVSKPPLSILPKINAAFSLNTTVSANERHTPTPPRQSQPQAPIQPPMPQLQPAPTLLRKRKTPTPPQSSKAQPRGLATPPVSIAVSGSSNNNSSDNNFNLLPMISSVHSMAASATPPLQLMATPPHSSSAHSFNEQLMISPHLLPQCTSITAQFVSDTFVSSINTMTTATTTTTNNNSSRINTSNNFKIQLPPKRTSTNTPSPAASPVLHTSPPPAASPRTITSTAISVSAVASGQTVVANKPSVRRVKPTTVLKSSDEAWAQRSRVPTLLLYEDALELSPKPATPTTPKSVTEVAKQPILSPLSVSSPQSQSSPQNYRQTATPKNSTPTPTPIPTPPGSVMDLTTSPEKRMSGTLAPITINLDESPPAKQTNDADDDGVVVIESPPKNAKKEEHATLQPEYEELLRACREADATPDMEKLIKNKLLKYYHSVHPNFVRSRGFRKNLSTVTEKIRQDPELVYMHLKTIVDELKVRSKSKAVEPVQEEGETSSSTTSSSTGNKHTDEQIKKLNKALYILTKRIEVLENAEVDWDDEDSTYLQVERYKKRACQIYEKICDLTGESKNAHRLVKKPIHFSGTSYPHFNKTLQGYINRTREFPDYYDVLRMLEHCNRQYDYGMAHFEMKRIAHDAFMKVGKLLQSRRKTDLYETVTHFTANAKDPANSDPALQAKLSENQKLKKRIGEIIEKFAREQDMVAEEQKEARLKAKSSKDNEDYAAASGAVDNEKGKTLDTDDVVKQKNAKNIKAPNENAEDYDDDDDDEDDDEEEEDEENGNLSELEADVDKLANGDLSEGESDSEIKRNAHRKKETKLNKNPMEQQQESACDNPTKTSSSNNEPVSSPPAAAVSATNASNVKSTKNSKPMSPTMVTKNLTRAKTADSNQQPQPQQQQTPLPNGHMKGMGPNAATSLLCALATATSRNEGLMGNQILLKKPAVTPSIATKVVATAATQNKAITTMAGVKTSEKNKHRTVAEIVISDEES